MVVVCNFEYRLRLHVFALAELFKIEEGSVLSTEAEGDDINEPESTGIRSVDS